MSFIGKILLRLGEFFVRLGIAIGKQQALDEQKAKNDALQTHYDEIDSQPRDLGDAIGRLRERSQPPGQ